MNGRGYRQLMRLGFTSSDGSTNDLNTVNLLTPPPPPPPINFLGPPVPNPNLIPVDSNIEPWLMRNQGGGVPIPTNGPLPPGAGWQQVEDPGNPFPWVYIGTGTGVPATPPQTNIPDGTLIKASGDEVDLIQNGQRRWIPDMATFNAMGFQWSSVQMISDAQFAAIPQGPPLTVRVSSSTSTPTTPAGISQQQLLALRSAANSASSTGTSFSQFFNQYKGWIIASGIALVVVPPILKKVTR